MNTHTLLREACRAFMANRLSEAETLCQSVLAGDPAAADAWDLLGGIRLRQQRASDAEPLTRRALSMKPDVARYWGNYAITLIATDRLEEALLSCDRALALEPHCVRTLVTRGDALRRLRRPREALACLHEVSMLAPHDAEVWCGRGLALLDVRRWQDALDAFDRALATATPTMAALNGRGRALAAMTRYAEALACFDRMLESDAHRTIANVNRGNTLYLLGDHEGALRAFDQCLAEMPACPSALVGRGLVLLEQSDIPRAATSFAAALAIDPQHPEALIGCARVSLDQADHDDVIERCTRLLATDPDSVMARQVLAAAYEEVHRHGEAIEQCERALAIDPTDDMSLTAFATSALRSCDWRRVEAAGASLESLVRRGSAAVPPFLFVGYSESSALQLQCGVNFVDAKWGRVQERPPGRRSRHPRLRVAYLSADWGNHAVAFQTAELFGLHDREVFEIIGVTRGRDDGSDVRRRILAGCDAVHDATRISNPQVAALLRELEVDIAVDLGGHTKRSLVGVLASRPAPVQVTYLGFPGTLGARFIDYVIADPIVLPFSEQPHFVERIVHLPECYQVSDRQLAIADDGPTREAEGLPRQAFVFCCFNQPYKIRPAIFDVWTRLLTSIPGSVLWLYGENADAVRNLRGEAQARGVEPERLVFAPHREPAMHLARLRLADLSLDTLPYASHATASFSLWAGLPIVTCLGTTFAGRVCASLLQAVGLPELVAHSLSDYEALARTLATDAHLLQRTRHKLAASRMTHPLFDTPRFCRHLEQAYLTMWRTFERGDPPRAFAVPADDGPVHAVTS